MILKTDVNFFLVETSEPAPEEEIPIPEPEEQEVASLEAVEDNGEGDDFYWNFDEEHDGNYSCYRHSAYIFLFQILSKKRKLPSSVRDLFSYLYKSNQTQNFHF